MPPIDSVERGAVSPADSHSTNPRPDCLPPAVRDATPTAKIVYLVLVRADDGLTVAALVAETGQSRRAVVRALDTLQADGVVRPRPDPSEPRRDVWGLAE